VCPVQDVKWRTGAAIGECYHFAMGRGQQTSTTPAEKVGSRSSGQSVLTAASEPLEAPAIMYHATPSESAALNEGLRLPAYVFADSDRAEDYAAERELEDEEMRDFTVVPVDVSGLLITPHDAYPPGEAYLVQEPTRSN